jgi:hypothetical protein
VIGATKRGGHSVTLPAASAAAISASASALADRPERLNPRRMLCRAFQLRLPLLGELLAPLKRMVDGGLRREIQVPSSFSPRHALGASLLAAHGRELQIPRSAPCDAALSATQDAADLGKRDAP